MPCVQCTLSTIEQGSGHDESFNPYSGVLPCLVLQLLVFSILAQAKELAWEGEGDCLHWALLSATTLDQFQLCVAISTISWLGGENMGDEKSECKTFLRSMACSNRCGWVWTPQYKTTREHFVILIVDIKTIYSCKRYQIFWLFL